MMNQVITPTQRPVGSSKLIEMVDVSNNDLLNEGASPLQLLRFFGLSCELESSLWFVGGQMGNTKADAYMMNLLQKALQKGNFSLATDIFVTPVMNPTGWLKNLKTNSRGIDLTANFPTVVNTSSSAVLAPETLSMMRWADTIRPKAIVTFSTSQQMIRYKNVPANIVERLKEISERPAYEFGTEPALNNDQGEVLPLQDVSGALGAWICEKYPEAAWIDFCVIDSKKSFEEVAQEEWKLHVGPALKWLCEGLRFNPPKEEPITNKLQVIPVLDMPPEFANLL